MMKSDFFPLLLHQNNENRLIMAKKKKDKKTKGSSGFAQKLSINNIFHNEKLNAFIGVFLILLALYLSLAFVSYFSTGAADQSVIEDLREGEIMNQNHEFANTCGSLGAHAAWYFIKRCFGLPKSSVSCGTI